MTLLQQEERFCVPTVTLLPFKEGDRFIRLAFPQKRSRETGCQLSISGVDRSSCTELLDCILPTLLEDVDVSKVQKAPAAFRVFVQ
jgi:hypothetical protein